LPPQDSDYRIEPLSKAHPRDNFHCGVEALDRYLKQQARQDADKRVALPFVLIQPPHHEVLGYYTLSASTIDVGDLPQPLAKKLPRYPQLPVTLLGRLAVDQGMRGRGVGEMLLMDAQANALKATQQVASMALVVDAKDDAAAAFYRHFEFVPLQVTPRRLFLPMATIAAIHWG